MKMAANVTSRFAVAEQGERDDRVERSPLDGDKATRASSAASPEASVVRPASPGLGEAEHRSGAGSRRQQRAGGVELHRSRWVSRGVSCASRSSAGRSARSPGTPAARTARWRRRRPDPSPSPRGHRGEHGRRGVAGRTRPGRWWPPARAVGAAIAAPTPCSSRAMTRVVWFQAIPQDRGDGEQCDADDERALTTDGVAQSAGYPAALVRRKSGRRR